MTHTNGLCFLRCLSFSLNDLYDMIWNYQFLFSQFPIKWTSSLQHKRHQYLLWKWLITGYWIEGRKQCIFILNQQSRHWYFENSPYSGSKKTLHLGKKSILGKFQSRGKLQFKTSAHSSWGLAHAQHSCLSQVFSSRELWCLSQAQAESYSIWARLKLKAVLFEPGSSRL